MAQQPVIRIRTGPNVITVKFNTVKNVDVGLHFLSVFRVQGLWPKRDHVIREADARGKTGAFDHSAISPSLRGRLYGFYPHLTSASQENASVEYNPISGRTGEAPVPFSPLSYCSEAVHSGDAPPPFSGDNPTGRISLERKPFHRPAAQKRWGRPLPCSPRTPNA